jgi:hypothetical protein
MLGPLVVEAAGRGKADHWTEDLTVTALLRSTEGVPVTLSVGDARDYALFEMEIITEKGTIRMEGGGSSWRIRRVIEDARFAGYRQLDRGYEQPGEYDKAMLAAVTNLYDAVTYGVPLACTGHEALAAQRVCNDIADLESNLDTATRSVHQALEMTE